MLVSYSLTYATTLVWNLGCGDGELPATVELLEVSSQLNCCDQVTEGWHF